MNARPITPLLETPRARRSLRIVSALIGVMLAACSQGDGEPCQRSSDCEDGLVCLSLGRGTERSVCGSPAEEEVDAGDDDAGDPMLPPDDAGREDAGPDDAGDEPSEDAGEEPADVDAG